ncbi:hypothetical protein LTR85_011244 [Meristemomyces frigidus]|nr:hypothetical protein LTR85_011244 [Meristemomyces frigidus]
MDSAERMLLVYEHKTQGRKLVPDGVSIMSEEDIVMAISAHPDIAMVTKAIEVGQTHIDLYKADLLTEVQKSHVREAAKGSKDRKAKAETSAGAEEIPWRVFLGHEWEGHSFEELVILTPDGSSKAVGSKDVAAEEEAAK